MKKTITKLIAIICLGYFIVPVSLAKEVKIFTADNVPSAEEMADILLNSTSEKSVSNAPKTRSLTFGKRKKTDPVYIGLPLKFNFNSSTLSTKSLTYLKQLGIMLNLEKMADENIMIVGHTDAIGPETYNLDLSQRRSLAVKEFLVSNYQVDPARIKTSGKGESDTLPGKSKKSSINRRVEFYRIQ